MLKRMHPTKSWRSLIFAAIGCLAVSLWTMPAEAESRAEKEFERGFQALADGDCAKAIVTFAQVPDELLEPKFVGIYYYWKGVALLQCDQSFAAKKNFLEMTKIMEGFAASAESEKRKAGNSVLWKVQVLEGLVWAHIGLGEFGAALERIDAMIATDSDNSRPGFRFMRIEVLQAKGDLEDALNELRSLISRTALPRDKWRDKELELQDQIKRRRKPV